MGGNAFNKNYVLVPVTEYVLTCIMPTLPVFSKSTNLSIVGNSFHVCNKSRSVTSDIDIVINRNPKEVLHILKTSNACFIEGKIVGNNLLTIFSTARGEHCQVDFMYCKDIELGKWQLSGNKNPSGVKGVFRNLLFAMKLKEKSDNSNITLGNLTRKQKITMGFPGPLKIKTNASVVDTVHVNNIQTIDSESLYYDMASIYSNLDLQYYDNCYNNFTTFEQVVDFYLESNIYTRDNLYNMFADYTKGSWAAKSEPEEREKALDYIRTGNIKTTN